MNPALAWYVARGSGLVAWALLAAAVLWGLFLSSGVMPKKSRRGWYLDLHRFLAGTALAFTLVHLVALVADNFVHFGVPDLLVPMASGWRPLPVAAGIVAFYLLLAVELSSLAGKRVPHPVWRKLHMLSFPLYLFATGHLLAAGTDVASRVVQALALLATAAIMFLTLVRVLAPRKAKAVPARVRPPAGGTAEPAEREDVAA